jgi:hypothetical protein
MMERISAFLVAKGWFGRKEKRELQKFTGKIDYNVPVGFLRDGESIHDLQ